MPDLTEPPRLPSLLFTEDLDIFSCGNKVGPSLRCFSDERRRRPASPRGVLTVNWQGTPSPAGGHPPPLGIEKPRGVEVAWCEPFCGRRHPRSGARWAVEETGRWFLSI